MYKVLTGASYDEFRLAGVLHECFCKYRGALQDRQNVTLYLDGIVKQNAITGDWGAVLPFEEVTGEVELDGEMVEITTQRGLTVANLGEPHLSRLVDVVSGDGWLDTVVVEGGEV